MFKTIQQKTIDFVEKYKSYSYSLKDDKQRYALSDAFFCAEDTLRNIKFWNWISKAIVFLKKKYSDIIVVDAWAWIWLLWLYALLNWADKCYFIEKNPYTVEVAKKFIEQFDLKWKEVIWLEWDAMKLKIKEKYHFIISETLASWFLEEDFVDIIKNLKSWLYSSWVIIPSKFDLLVQEIDLQWKVLAYHKYDFESKKILFKPNILVKAEETKQLKYIMDTEIFDWVFLKAWECMSFMNPRIKEKK